MNFILLLVILINHQALAGGKIKNIFNKAGSYFRNLGDDIKDAYVDAFKNSTDAFTTTVSNLPDALQDAIKSIPKGEIYLLSEAIGLYGIQLGGKSLYPLCSVIVGCENGQTCVTDNEPAGAIGFGKCGKPLNLEKRGTILPTPGNRPVISPQPGIDPPQVFVPIAHPPVVAPSAGPRRFWRNVWRTADGIARAVSGKILVAGELALNALESGKTKVVKFGNQVFSDAKQLLSKIQTKTSAAEQFVDSVFNKVIRNSEIEITAFVTECKGDTASCIDNVFARVEVSDFSALAVGELSALTRTIPGLPVVQNVADGFVGAMAQMVQDMANPFIYPVQTAATMQEFINNPAAHARAIVDGVKATCVKNAAKCAGMLIFAVFTGGESLAAGNINLRLNKAGNVLQRFADGFVGGASTFIQGTGDLVVHPLNSAMSLVNVVRRPAEAAIAFANAIKTTCTVNTAGCVGNGVFTIATLVVPGVGEAEIADETATFAKMAADEVIGNGALTAEEESFIQACLLLKRGTEAATVAACEAAGIESAAAAGIDAAPSTSAPRSVNPTLSTAERAANVEQLRLAETGRVIETTLNGHIVYTAQTPQIQGYNGPLLKELRKKTSNFIFKAENLAEIDPTVPAGPVFVGFHGTASTFASSLLERGATAFTAHPPYWDLDVLGFKGRDFDANPLNKADQNNLGKLKKSDNLIYDQNQFGPGIDLETAMAFARETAAEAGSQPAVLEVWMNGPPKVHKVNDAVTYTSGLSDAPWFSNPSNSNPKVSAMKSFMEEFDVITGLHVKKLENGIARIALQSKVNPGSFQKVMLTLHTALQN